MLARRHSRLLASAPRHRHPKASVQNPDECGRGAWGASSDGKSRQLAFLGFRSTEMATQAVKYFNHTYLDTSKLQVEVSAMALCVRPRLLLVLRAREVRAGGWGRVAGRTAHAAGLRVWQSLAHTELHSSYPAARARTAGTPSWGVVADARRVPGSAVTMPGSLQGEYQGWRACPHAQPGRPTRGAPSVAARQLH